MIGKLTIKALCCVVILLATGASPVLTDPIPSVDTEVALDATPAQAGVQLVPVLTGLASPIYLTHAGDSSNRLFVVEQAGVIKVLQPGASAPTVFLNITAKVLSGGERGLLGLAFHPQFPSDPRFFVNYTRRSDGASVIAEYRVSANPNVAGTAEQVLLVIPQPFANHNGGMMAFGPDGFLYIAMGDGGSGNDPGNRAQNRNELLGKILRIDIGSPGQSPASYSSPDDNPFFGDIPGRDEIYALGLRNPWRFSFDRGTGQLYAGDVGQGVREEIDIITLGGNYGWRIFEGTPCTNNDPALCNGAGFTPPIAEYAHQAGRCSITGGYVYRGALSTLPTGAYVFGDYCSGEIFLLDNDTVSVELDSDLNIASFGEDEAGEIYVVALGGAVYRLAQAGPPSGSATFVRADTTTRGNWRGVYGAEGYRIIQHAVSEPGYAQVARANATSYVWQSSTQDLRALQKVNASDRIAAAWYSSSSFSVWVNFTDGQTHRLAMYFLDWQRAGRSQTVQVRDASSAAVLDSRNVTAFSEGQYLVWDITGSVEIRMTRTGPYNAVVSGLFYDAAP